MTLKTLFICLLLIFPFFAQAQSKGKAISIASSYEFTCSGTTDRIRLKILVPQNIAGKQEVVQVTYSHTPQRVYFRDGNCYAEFLITNPSSKERIVMNADMTIYRNDFNSSSSRNIDTTSENPEIYLKGEKYIESDDPQISRKAQELQGYNDEETLRNIYDFVSNHVKYQGYIPQSLGARAALLLKRGDCTEFSTLFVALCRASGLPARTVSGFTTDWTNTPCHGWVEVFIPEKGWVAFDPTPGNWQRFNKLKNRYIYLSRVSNDKELEGFEIYYYNYRGDKVEIRHDLNVRKR